MKAKTSPVTTTPVPVSRRVKAASPVQMSLMELEPEAAPALPRPQKVTPAAAPKLAKPKTAKSVSVKADKKTPPTETVRIVPETLLTSGAVWKMSGKNGVAYVKDAALAGELLAIEPKNLARAAMAVYYDKKGKAFAWQVRFDTDRWEEVMNRLA